jgi:hypothetical protein
MCGSRRKTIGWALASETMIPLHLHFIWIGPELPWFAKLAIGSALRRVPDARVSLWATHDLTHDKHVNALRVDERFQLGSLDERTLFEDAPSALPLELLREQFSELSEPAGRSNIARLLLLARFGGIYLDTDTTTLRDLTPLCSLGAFCGLEHVVWPMSSQNLLSYRLFGGRVRSVLRRACASVPHGERAFVSLSRWYSTAANNAVLGFSQGHNFLLATLQRVAELPPEERARRYRLGTYLLQEMLEKRAERDGVTALSPSHFYPLGPVISRQYFNTRNDVTSAVAAIVKPETYLIHWYASVSELRPYDEARVQCERDRSVFARLAYDAL